MKWIPYATVIGVGCAVAFIAGALLSGAFSIIADDAYADGVASVYASLPIETLVDMEVEHGI